MKRDKKTINKRHMRMLEFIREKKDVRVDELAEIFDISIVTARRDLQILEEQGHIVRYHGGAMINGAGEENEEITRCKRSISAYASTLIKPGDSVLINGSSTALNTLYYVDDMDLRVFTNNACAVELVPPEGVVISLTGGTMKGSVLVGDIALRSVLDTRADKALIGCSGLSPNGEILCGIPSELAINESMIAHAKEYYILADFTKAGKSSSYASFSLDGQGTVITDENTPKEIVESLRKAGMKVIQVEKDWYEKHMEKEVVEEAEEIVEEAN